MARNPRFSTGKGRSGAGGGHRGLALATVLTLLILLPSAVPPARAGSTGTTGLYTPQGGAAGTANGDFVASSSPGLDTFYRYFVEVPPGLSRLVIEIFDADIGIGGDPEGNAGRDRDRSGWNTTATYSLVNPGGTSRPTAFTTGDVDEPAGADNAWLALYDSSGETFADSFSTNAYTNNNGSLSWSTNWVETNDDNNATAGLILVTAGELAIQDDGGGASTLHREANLTGNGFTSATFSFDWRESNNVDNADSMGVQVSSNGGGSWTTLENITGAATSGTRSYDITAFLAANTRIRFIEVNGYSGSETFFVDNVQIRAGSIVAGHWEIRVNQAAGGDAINAIGLRAHDGNSGSTGTELNVYYDSHNQYGINPPASGTLSRSYDFYPYITSGCSASKNDFDHDSNSGNVGSMSFTSRNGSFTQSYTSSSLSANNVWRRDSFSGWTSDTDSVGYGIWSADATINSYLVGGVPNGNYANLWMANFQAAANPPTANPTANAFRVYLPTDAGAAPAKPYVEQLLRYAQVGPNPPVAGQTTRYAVTVRVVNPGAQAITFSTPTNVVTANVPGGGTVYAGSAAVGQGSIVSQPSVGSTGNIVWNPGTLAAGATAILTYRVNVTPGSAGQRVLATATPASGNGTRAQFLDHTGNTGQARATYLAGPICEIGVTEGLLTQAVVSSFTAHDEGGAVVVEWQTASEAGTAGFDLYRRDEAKASGKEWVLLNDRLLLGLLHAPQGGTYRFVDSGVSPRDRATYLLAETEATGGRRFYGPFSPTVEAGRGSRPENGFERTPHAAPPAPVQATDEDARSFTAAEAPANTANTAQAIRLTVREPGLHYVRSADIAALLGVTRDKAEKMVGAGELSLTRLGQPVPWIAAPGEGPAGREAKRAEGLYFYGEPMDSLYTADTVYKLARGNALWMKVAQVSSSAPTQEADPAASFLDVLRREEDRLPATVIAPDPESDYWFWEFLQSGDATFGAKTFSIDAPGLKPGNSPDREGSLTVSLQGATTTGVAGEHRAEVRLNGTVLGEVTWEGIAAETATFPVPPGLLQETGNQVEVAGLLDSGVPFSILYVDAVELAYPRSYQARGDALRFGADGNADLSVAGFSAASVVLLDVTNPAQPLWVEGAAREAQVAGQDPGVGLVRLRFRPASRHSRYLAAGPAGVLAPEMAAWRNDGLRSSQGADYVVLTTAALAPAAERLANLRRAQGLEARVVDMAAVADEFGPGVASPHAVRSFLAFTRTGWRKAPRYVVLAGAGTLDYRDLLGFGGNLLPPLFVQSTGGLFASDNRLADTTGDGLPEMAVGRLPVTTAAELDAYVDKLAAYENGAGDGGEDWVGRALFLADAPDRGANFAAASERIAGILPSGYTADRIDLTATPLDQARGQLFQALGEGVSLVNFLGHGGLDRLSGAGLLANADVPALTNGERLPVVTAMTCTVNRFGVPGVPPLGELLVDRPGGGAVAVWSASGLSVNAAAGDLAERFYRLLAEPGNDRLGDLILRSLKDFAALGGDNSLLDLYNLLGDPALRLRRATTPPPVPGTSDGGE